MLAFRSMQLWCGFWKTAPSHARQANDLFYGECPLVGDGSGPKQKALSMRHATLVDERQESHWFWFAASEQPRKVLLEFSMRLS
jgi:hypothetical protein